MKTNYQGALAANRIKLIFTGLVLSAGVMVTQSLMAAVPAPLDVITNNQVITNFIPTNGSVFAVTNTAGLNATGGGSTNPVIFTVISGPGVISGLTNLTFTNSGTVSVMASQAGDTNWNTAPDVTNTYSVLPAAMLDQTITNFRPINGSVFVVTNKVGLSAQASSGLPVSFAVQSGPGAITGGTNLAFASTGLVSIVASQAGDTNWDAAPDLTNTFQVSIGAAAALGLSDFMFLPRAIHIGAHPSNIKFTLVNNGPLDMSKHNTRVLLEFYLSTDTTFSASADVKIGEYGMDITLPAGSSVDVHLLNKMLKNIIIPTMKHGEYYVFLRVRHVAPSELYDPGTNNVVMRNRTIKVGLGNDGELTEPIKNDCDGDGISDLALYQESTGNWEFLLSGRDYVQDGKQFGGPGYHPILGDYDGDGENDPTLYNEATGRWRISLSGNGQQQVRFVLGGPGCLPVIGDYDGDGKMDPAVYQESTGKWLILLSDSGSELVEVELGGSGYQAVSGDYDGDGKSDPAVYNKSTGRFKAMLSGSGYQTADILLGASGYQPVPGDYDWDGKTDPAVYNAATGEWIVWLSSEHYAAVHTFLGGMGCTAVPADYDGDGKVDPAYYKESSGTWMVLLSGQGYQSVSAHWGATGYHAVGTAQ